MNISKEVLSEVKQVATRWQELIDHERERSEQTFHDTMTRMLKNPMNKMFLIELLDQSFRSHNPKRVADQLEFLFDKYKDTDFFTLTEELLVWAFRNIGIYVPKISVPLFIKYLRNDVKNVVIPGEHSSLVKHIKKRKAEGTRVNINIIGEIVLGEDEANERIKKYITALEHPEIDYISIKISTIFSQISPIAHEWSVEQISQRLETIYSAAMKNTYVDAKGVQKHKFINLDMEEYKDLHLTIDAFMRTLSREAFSSLYAGIVVQAYLPDALEQVQRLATWAKERVAKGGAPIKIRLVKGANQEMELTESSLRGWPCVTYDKKADTDANFKKVMNYLLDPELASSVHTGIASHNLFDQALGMLLARERGIEHCYSAEMLEGMSETAYKLLKREKINVVLYAPIATHKTFTNAIAYLIRRFDENTAEQNFLRHSFGLHTGSEAWKSLLQSYDDALMSMQNLHLEPFRMQNRNESPLKPNINLKSYQYHSESDTDFALPCNQVWAEKIADKWKNISLSGGYHASSVIAAEAVESIDVQTVMDKSQYHQKVVVGSYMKAGPQDLRDAVETAIKDPDGWRALSAGQRQEILMNVAHEFRTKRGDLIGIAAAEVGKVFGETDVEISEAIDFLNFYPYSVQKINELEGVRTQGRGVGLVVSPWNFPIAIAAGGIAAALASGNTVILKPASQSALCAHMLCECFWNAGVSKNTLQLALCDGSMAGEHLISNRGIDFTIFTGSEATAYEMLRIRPDLHLSAETGGKDATIVTAMADHDQAVKNVVASAFSNSGQKCSATSLLVLEKELYEDEGFKRMLIDATASIEVGSVWELKNRIGTLVSSPTGNLQKALDFLDEGERWLIPPSYADDENPYILKPSIRWGTKPGDFCHMNELFGPVLSVMCAQDLDHAIDIVNATGYGLTSGMESLDEREQSIWKAKILAGNLYINRGTTGAIVLRQPFGGMRKSAVGSGRKAGGYNYVTQFMSIDAEAKKLERRQNEILLFKGLEKLVEGSQYRDELEQCLDVLFSFVQINAEEFQREHDYTHIRGESNIIRYLGVKSTLLRLSNEDTVFEIICSYFAAKLAGSQVTISLDLGHSSKALKWLKLNASKFMSKEDELIVEADVTFVGMINQYDRIRVLRAFDQMKMLYKEASKTAKHITAEPFVAHGRIELMHYYSEQSVSDSYHRYGNLGLRGLKKG